MSSMAKQVEMDFFKANSGLSSTVHSLQSHQRAYFSTQVVVQPSEHIDEIYKHWLQKVIDDNGGTAVGQYFSDLLKQAVAALGGTVRDRESDNKIELFQNL